MKFFAVIPDETKELINNLPNNSGVGAANLTTILNWIYIAGGIVAVIVIVYAGAKYILSQGQPEKMKQASQIIAYAIIGLVVVVLAAAITAFVSGIIGGSTQ